MAQLPYKFTICPPGPEPKQYTALTPGLINAMRFSKDLTIDQRAYVWPVKSSNFEGKLRDLLENKSEAENT